MARTVSPMSQTSKSALVRPFASQADRRRFGGSVICEVEGSQLQHSATHIRGDEVPPR